MNKRSRKCEDGHDMTLVDVRLRAVGGSLAYHPPRSSVQGLELLKTYECDWCGQVDEVREEME